MGQNDWFVRDLPGRPHDQQDILFGQKGDSTHGHMVLKDVDGDNELEVVYSRDEQGKIEYDSGE